MRRMWVNQPSALQQGHRWHGELVLAEEKNPESESVRVWPIQGDIVSAEMMESWLSSGWPEHLRGARNEN